MSLYEVSHPILRNETTEHSCYLYILLVSLVWKCYAFLSVDRGEKMFIEKPSEKPYATSLEV